LKTIKGEDFVNYERFFATEAEVLV